jgi:POT family proton-dependent oligopeptide transporter
MNGNQSEAGSQQVFGHPPGIFTLFFAEMWERFSYYGMRSLLVFYMIKGFLGYGDSDAYAVYGAYTALVYMTPFFGGMLADRLIGARRAVILGGLFMAAGHLMMTIEKELAFFTALALLILGNGFFKPNISTIVGSLYPPGSPKRDGGFTIFYMGINLGAAMSPLVCGYIGETYGWHYGFGLATIGMLTGLAVFVAPSIIAQTSVALVAIAAAANMGMLGYQPLVQYSELTSLLVLLLLVVAGVVCFVEQGRGGDQ